MGGGRWAVVLTKSWLDSNKGLARGLSYFSPMTLTAYSPQSRFGSFTESSSPFQPPFPLICTFNGAGYARLTSKASAGGDRYRPGSQNYSVLGILKERSTVGDINKGTIHPLRGPSPLSSVNSAVLPPPSSPSPPSAASGEVMAALGKQNLPPEHSGVSPEVSGS